MSFKSPVRIPFPKIFPPPPYSSYFWVSRKRKTSALLCLSWNLQNYQPLNEKKTSFRAWRIHFELTFHALPLRDRFAITDWRRCPLVFLHLFSQSRSWGILWAIAWCSAAERDVRGLQWVSRVTGAVRLLLWTKILFLFLFYLGSHHLYFAESSLRFMKLIIEIGIGMPPTTKKCFGGLLFFWRRGNDLHLSISHSFLVSKLGVLWVTYQL